MTRSIAMLLIGLLFGGGIGFVTAAGLGVTLDGHDHGVTATADATAPHAHGNPVTYPQGPDEPSLVLSVTRDSVSGWTLRMEPRNFRFAPENASLGHVDGEGHAHVYVNGTKVMRAYGPWVHLDSLPEGEVTVRAALYSNDHRPLAVGESPVSDEVRVTVEPSGHVGH